MHQIRVHTQHLGYPIANDPVYNSTVFGADKGKGFCGAAPEVARIAETLCARIRASGDQQQQADVGGDELAVRAAAEAEASDILATEDGVVAEAEAQPKAVARRHPRALELPEAAHTLYWPACTECQVTREDPRPEAMRIYLHAYRLGWERRRERELNRMLQIGVGLILETQSYKTERCRQLLALGLVSCSKCIVGTLVGTSTLKRACHGGRSRIGPRSWLLEARPTSVRDGTG